MTASPADVGVIPVVSLGSGNVTVESENSASHKLVSVEPLTSPVSVKTSLGASASVILEGVGTVRMGPATAARVTPGVNGLTFALTEGTLCVQSQANSLAVWVGQVQVTPSSPSAVFDIKGDSGSLTLAVFVGDVSVRHASESLAQSAGSALVIESDGTGQHQVLLRQTVLTDFAPLDCPDQQVIATAEAASPSSNPPSGGHGSGSIIGVLLGLVAAAAALAGHGGGGSGSTSSTAPTEPPVTPTTPPPTATPTPTPTPTPIQGSTPTPTPPPTSSPTPPPTSSPTPPPTSSPTPPPTPTPTPGQLVASTNSIAIVGTGTTATFTASEDNYTGVLSAASSNGAVASVSGSGNGPGPVTFTVTGVAPGNANITVSDDHGGQQVVFTSVTTGTMTVQPQTLSFQGPHGQKKFTATDTSAGDTTVYSAVSSDPTIATVDPSTQTGRGPFKFSVSPVNSGQTTITVSDVNGTAVVSVGVGVSPLRRAIISPPPQQTGAAQQPSPRSNPPPTALGRLALSASTLTIVGPTRTQLFTASEPGYSGPISASVVGPAIVDIDHPSGPGPIQMFKLISRAAGTTTIRIYDGRGNSVLLSVTIAPAVPAASPIFQPTPAPRPPPPRPPGPSPR